MEIKVGDTVYIIRHHIKNKKNIGYYIDKCRVCDFGSRDYVYIDHNLDSLDDLPRKTAKRIYKTYRIYKDIKEAQKECDLKNELMEVRKKYNEETSKIKERIYKAH